MKRKSLLIILSALSLTGCTPSGDKASEETSKEDTNNQTTEVQYSKIDNFNSFVDNNYSNFTATIECSKLEGEALSFLPFAKATNTFNAVIKVANNAMLINESLIQEASFTYDEFKNYYKHSLSDNQIQTYFNERLLPSMDSYKVNNGVYTVISSDLNESYTYKVNDLLSDIVSSNTHLKRTMLRKERKLNPFGNFVNPNLILSKLNLKDIFSKSAFDEAKHSYLNNGYQIEGILFSSFQAKLDRFEMYFKDQVLSKIEIDGFYERMNGDFSYTVTMSDYGSTTIEDIREPITCEHKNDIIFSHSVIGDKYYHVSRCNECYNDIDAVELDISDDGLCDVCGFEFTDYAIVEIGYDCIIFLNFNATTRAITEITEFFYEKGDDFEYSTSYENCMFNEGNKHIDDCEIQVVNDVYLIKTENHCYFYAACDEEMVYSEKVGYDVNSVSGGVEFLSSIEYGVTTIDYFINNNSLQSI